MDIERDYYFCRLCGYGVGIGDEELGIAGVHKITKSVTEKITYASQLIPSFERASECLEKLGGIKVSAAQTQKISEEVGQEIFEQEKVEAEAIYKEPEKFFENKLPKDKKPFRLYIMADGSAINTRVEENGSTWREMKLGMVFSEKDMIHREDGDAIIANKEYVAYLGSWDEFKKFLFAAAVRNGYGSFEEVVVLGDGARWIWKMCEEVFPDAKRILDYYHMSENVHAYARFIYPNSEAKSKEWADNTINKIKAGQVQEVIDALPEDKDTELPCGVPNLKVYLEHNKDKVNYDSLKKDGYIIGSGSIESGNKMVIHQRLKQAGMRWGIKGAQYIATLRTKHESGLWYQVQNHIAA